MAEADPSSTITTTATATTSSNIFSQKNRPPDDTVFFTIYPDFTLTPSTTAELHSLHLQILHTLSPFTSNYIWQHQPFTLSVVSTPIPHLHGHLRFGDNLEDEWFVVFLLFYTSKQYPNLSIRVWDSDGEFLLIEAAFHLPRWLNPDTSTNRVFIRRGQLCIIPKSHFPSTPDLRDALLFLIQTPVEISIAPDAVQKHLQSKIIEYPEKAMKNTHNVRVRVPVSVAQVLKHEPCLISMAVEGFYDRDIDTMKLIAKKMERFLPYGSGEELVQVVVKMSRAMYAQLVQQTFQPPRCYPTMPPRSDVVAYAEAELGMKITCGLEMMYQLRKKEGMEGKGSTWEAFRESLESSGYFQGLLPGSNEYKRLMQNAEEYYRNSSLHSRASEMLNAPVRRIDEILALPHNVNDFKGQELQPSDDDSWLYGGDDELDAALDERQKEMALYESKYKKKQKQKEQGDGVPSSSENLDDYDLADVAKSMQSFVKNISSYEGAEVPKDRGLENVDLDVDRFMKDLESVMRSQAIEDMESDGDLEEGSSSDMDFDDSEDENDTEDHGGGGDPFMDVYSEALNKELKDSTITESFVRANEKSFKKDEGTSSAATADIEEEDFTPVDVDVNLVKSFLDSFSSQQGLPGPASNLLGLMGLQLPPDSSQGK